MAASDPTELARHALEQVCSGSDPSAAVGVYSPDFRDHVNARDYRGHEGIRQSLGLYQLVFSDGDLRIHVEDQVTEGDRVASRWVAEGHNRGRPIRIWGIVISRVDEGEIVEDWAASDSLDLIRQLGPRRTLLLGISWLRSRHR
jgi:SnoaL-like polyketide cyclase